MTDWSVVIQPRMILVTPGTWPEVYIRGDRHLWQSDKTRCKRGAGVKLDGGAAIPSLRTPWVKPNLTPGVGRGGRPGVHTWTPCPMTPADSRLTNRAPQPTKWTQVSTENSIRSKTYSLLLFLWCDIFKFYVIEIKNQGERSFSGAHTTNKTFKMMLTLSGLNLPLSSSSTTSRELLSQFSTCSEWRWFEMVEKIKKIAMYW